MTYEEQVRLANEAIGKPTDEKDHTPARGGDEEDSNRNRLILVGGAVAFVTIVAIGVATQRGDGDDSPSSSDDAVEVDEPAEDDGDSALDDEPLPGLDDPPEEEAPDDLSSADDQAAEEAGGDEEPPQESRVADVRVGMWQGERIVVVRLDEPADPDHEQMLEITSDQEDRIIGGFRPADEFSTSVCVGSTPSCVEGFFPIVGEIGEDPSVVIWRFALDALDNSTGVCICASVKTTDDGTPLPTSCDFEVELSDEELDPATVSSG